jgi:hypothetical protein
MPLLRPRVVTRSDIDTLPLKPPGIVGVTALPSLKEDDYLTRLVKYIPGEIVAAYLCLAGGFVTLNSPWAPWLSVVWVGILVVLTALWIPYATSDEGQRIPSHPFQTYSAVAAFLVWAFALGGAWVKLLPAEFQTVQPMIGSMAVITATFAIPLIDGSAGGK